VALGEGAVELTAIVAVTAFVSVMFTELVGMLQVGRCIAPAGEEVSAHER